MRKAVPLPNLSLLAFWCVTAYTSIRGLLQSNTGWEFHPHKTGQFSEAFCSFGLQVNDIFGNPSVNSNLQLEWLLLFITISAPSEQHENHNIPQGDLSTPYRGCSVWLVLGLKNICVDLHCQISFLNRKLYNFKGNTTDIFTNIQEWTRISGQVVFCMHGPPTDLFSPNFSCLKSEILSCPRSPCQQMEIVISKMPLFPS